MRKLFYFIVLSLAFTVAVCAQTEKLSGMAKPLPADIVAGSLVQTLSLESKLLGHTASYQVVLPASYRDQHESAHRYPVLYLMHGLTQHFDVWGKNTDLFRESGKYGLIIVTPEGENAWYTDSVTVPADKYESYIIRELIPEVDKRFRTISERRGRMAAGLSMGGYGAIKFGLKHPEMFKLVGSFSGTLGVASFTAKDAGRSDPTIKNIYGVFGSDDSPTRRDNDIFRMVREITPEKLKAVPFIYQSCGTEDFLIQNNRDFLALLNEKKVPHEYREHPGGHDWAFWGDQIREFLALTARS